MKKKSLNSNPHNINLFSNTTQAALKNCYSDNFGLFTAILWFRFLHFYDIY